MGWIWCATCRQHCAVCRNWVIGVWRHFVDEITSNKNVCAVCAGGEG